MLKDKASPTVPLANPKVAGLAAFHRQRKHDSRERLLAAALTRFCAQGYLSVSVEDIASEAGVSRMTFYRHFSDKADLAAELFKAEAAVAMPRYLQITQTAFEDRDAVGNWIASLFEADRANRRLLRVFTQAGTGDDDFTERAQELIGNLIAELGGAIPAFSFDPDRPEQRRRWLEAWLLLYEILDQSNHAALASGVASDPLVIDILADRFLKFVTSATS